MKKEINFLSVFNDSDQNLSSMNFVWALSITIIVGIWIVLSVMSNQLQHLTAGDALWFTTLFSGKVLQSFFESNQSTTEQKKSALIRFIWVFAVLGIVISWAYISYQTKSIQHFTTGDAAWFAALFSSKVGQTYVERS